MSDGSLGLLIYGFPASGKTFFQKLMQADQVLRNYSMLDTDDITEENDYLGFSVAKSGGIQVDVWHKDKKVATYVSPIVVTNRLEWVGVIKDNFFKSRLHFLNDMEKRAINITPSR
jgi:hypothetical protein